MTKVYYDPISKGFYQDDIHRTIPSSSVEISDELRWELLDEVSSGKEIVFKDGILTSETVVATYQNVVDSERLWRDSELQYADIELYKVQDSDSKAVSTVAAWREYRKLLRSWPEHPKFPDTKYRPNSPKTKGK